MPQQVYNTTDLAFFQKVLAEAQREIGAFGRAAPEFNDEASAASLMAAAIFRSAASGERDAARLKLQAIAAVVDRETLAVLRGRKRA